MAVSNEFHKCESNNKNAKSEIEQNRYFCLRIIIIQLIALTYLQKC